MICPAAYSEQVAGLEAFARLLDDFEVALTRSGGDIGGLAPYFAEVVESLPPGERAAFLMGAGWWLAESLKGFTVSGDGVRSIAAQLGRKR